MLLATLYAASMVLLPASSVEPNPQRDLTFVKNEGQWNQTAKFLYRSNQGNLWVTARGLVYDLARPLQSAASTLQRPDLSHTKPKVERQSVFMEFEGATGKGKAIGFRPSRAEVRYYKRKQAYESATFEKVAIKDLYQGIDLVVYLDRSSHQPRYDLVVHPGADPRKIRIRYHGADSVRNGGANDLLIGTHFTQIREGAPVAYQPTQTSAARIVARRCLNIDGTHGFRIADYDRTKNLVIDPILWSTYQGGGREDAITSVQPGPDHTIYVSGWTYSNDFPSVYNYGVNHAGSAAFCSRYNIDGSLQWTTFLGGEGYTVNKGLALAIAKDGTAYMTGVASADFPVTTLAFQTQLNSPDTNIDGPVQYGTTGTTDAFVARIYSFGAMDWASFLGGSGEEAGLGIALDNKQNPIVVGSTTSAGAISPGEAEYVGFTGSQSYCDFPVTPNAFQFAAMGGANAFYAKFHASGYGVYYVSLLGGYPLTATEANAVTFDSTGDIYIAGWTNASLKAAWNRLFGPGILPLIHEDRLAAGKNAFVMHLTYRTGGPLVAYNAFGAPGGDTVATAVLADGEVPVVAGWSEGQVLTWPNGVQPNRAGGKDGFIYRFDPQLLFPLDATMIGGSGNDRITSMVKSGDGYRLAGTTNSGDFPVTPTATQPTYCGGGSDAFVFKTDPYFHTLDWSSYLGGSGHDEGLGVAQLEGNTFAVGGLTNSPDVPQLPYGHQPNYGGGDTDGFLTYYDNSQTIVALTTDLSEVTTGDPVHVTVTLAKSFGIPQTVHVQSSNASFIPEFDVVIPAYSTSAAVEVTVQGIPIGVARKVVLSATVGKRRAVTLTVVAPFALSLDKATVVGGNDAIGTVTIPNPRSSDMTITLATRPTATVPSTVTIVAGETQATFTINTRRPTSDVKANIKASFGAYTTTLPLLITRG